jgi:hypothetical protein
MHPKAPHSFTGKVIVVTGASTGIGAAAARGFAAAGGRVALVARSLGPLEQVVADIRRDGGEAMAVPADVAQSASAQFVMQRVVDAWGGIDVLVNNAGVNHRGAVEQRSADELSAIVSLNLTAPILWTRAVLPFLRQRGGGAIVNVASLAGRIPLPHEATYSATKFGLRAFSFALAEELRASPISVSVVSPGPVETGFIMSDMAHVPDLVFSQPLSTAEEIAALILASAADGARERLPAGSPGFVTTAGYLFPALQRSLTPLLERRGRAAKAAIAKRRR